MKIISTEDVFSDNQIYFPREFEDSPNVSRLRTSAKSITASLPADGEDFRKALRGCYNMLCEMMPDEAQLKVFCAQEIFFDNSAVRRSKGLWRSHRLLEEVGSHAKQIGPVRTKEFAGKLRYYAFCSLRLRDAFCAFDTIRRIKSCFGLFDDNFNIADPDALDVCYNIAFSKVNTPWVNWPRLIRHLAREKSRLVRVTGAFDDREVSIDVFNW